MVATSLSAARFTAGVSGDATVFPRVWQAHTPLIYCHSASMTGGQALGVGQLPSVGPLVRRLAADGWPVAAPTIGLEWGNATSQARITDALTWLRDERGSDAPAVLIGSSMGACAALCWASAHPSDVAAVVGFIPAIDLQAIRVANTAGLRGSIDAAYGVTYPAALPVGADPATLTSSLSGIPIQLWTASDDLVSVNSAAFATSTGAQVNNVGALGHTDAAVAAVAAVTLTDFIAPYA